MEHDAWREAGTTVFSRSGVAVSTPVLRGGAGQKRVAIVAHIHGDEVSAILILHHLLTEWMPSSFQGTMDLYTAANPLALFGGTRVSITDGGDLNRRPQDGSAPDTERLRRHLIESLEGSALVVHLHNLWSTGCLTGIHFSGFDDATASTRLRNLQFFDCDVIWEVSPDDEYASAFRGTTDFELTERGIPNVSIELPHPVFFTNEQAKRVVGGLARIPAIAQILNLRESPAEPARAPPRVCGKKQVAPHSGLYVPDLDPPARVKQGTPVGTLYPLDRPDRPMRILMPRDGLLFVQRPTGLKRVNDVLFLYGVGASQHG